MRATIALLTLLAFTAIGLCQGDTTCVDTFSVDGKHWIEVVCQRMCVKWEAGAPHDTVVAMETACGADTLAGPFLEWVIYEIDTSHTLKDVYDLFEASSWVINAHPDLFAHPCLPYMPSDAYWSDQDKYLGNWPNDGLPPSRGRGFNLTKAWGLTCGNDNCVIDLLDTGSPRCPETDECQIEPCENHPDFWTGNTFRCVEFYMNPALQTSEFADVEGHATVMAGIIGAYHNIDGVAGINDQSPLLISKLYSRLESSLDETEPGGGVYNVIPAVQALWEMPIPGKKIVVYPYATDAEFLTCEDFDFGWDEATLYEDLIYEAYLLDILFVFPTGLNGDAPVGVGMPAIFAGCGSRGGFEDGYENVIAVGAYNLFGAVSPISPGGPIFTLRAPGGRTFPCRTQEQTPYDNQDIRVATIHASAEPNGCVVGRIMNQGCTTWSWGWYAGTSAAAANVAGLASLIWSSAPDITAGDVRATITGTCFNPQAEATGYRGRTDDWGWGAPNCLAAILAAPSSVELELVGDVHIDCEMFDPITWDPVPLEIDRNLSVPSGKTLRIAHEDEAYGLPGFQVVVKAGKQLRVASGGRLELYQTAEPGSNLEIILEPGARIVVESGGRLTATSASATNSIVLKGISTDPSDAWRGIYLSSTGNTFTNCVFENASVAIRALPGSGVSLDDCQFNGCGVAVAAVDANVTLAECVISGGSYGVLSACDSDVRLTDCDIQSTTRAGLWLQGFSRCDLDQTLFAGNGLGQTYFYGGIRNTFGTMTLHCVTSRDNYGPGLSQLGGFTDMAPASGEAGKNTFVDNLPPDGPAGTQVYFDNAQFNLCNGRNKICAGDGLLIMDATPTWHDVTNNHWCDGYDHRVPSEYYNGGDDGAPQNDRCALTGLSYCMETLAAELFYEAWVEENTMLYQEAYDGYKYILETYPKSPEAKLCPERIVTCTKALQQSWDERRAYFLSIADTTTDPGLEFETRASAAWCLVEKDFFDDARDEFIALLDSADDNYKAQKAALCELMIELKEAPWDSIGSLDSAPDEDRMLSVLDRMESVLSGTAQNVPRAAVPTRYALYQNYPNPFNPTTEIRFDLPEDARVELKIFNTLGQLVTTLVNDARPAGSYRVIWDSRSASGIPLAAGVYVYQLKAGDFTDAKKMVLIR